MFNLKTERNSIKKRKDFKEVATGFRKWVMFEEARRCPQCHDPVCHHGCPLEIDIPKFVRLLREQNIQGALRIIQEENDLPGICGRICHAPCETACILHEEGNPIKIRALERHAADYGKKREWGRKIQERNGPKVAVVGSGPAGLMAAARLARRDYRVTVFEALPLAGGVLRYGIPEFRLPQRVLDEQIEEFRLLGVDFQTDTVIGRTVTFEELKEQEFEAIVLALGRGDPELSHLEGEHFIGIHYAQEFLLPLNFMTPKYFERQKSLKIGKNIAVLGDGNAALDCARACARLADKVRLVFEGTEDDMEIYPGEKEDAKQEGVTFEPMTRPAGFVSQDGFHTCGIRCLRMDFADPHGEGTWQLMPVPDSGFVLDADTVFIAKRRSPGRDTLKRIPGLKVLDDGRVWRDEDTFMTSVPGVFVAGDMVPGFSRLVEAMASGKSVASFVHQYLKDSNRERPA